MILSFVFQSSRIFVENMFLDNIIWYTHSYHSLQSSFSFLTISSHIYAFSFYFSSSGLDQGMSVKSWGSKQQLEPGEFINMDKTKYSDFPFLSVYILAIMGRFMGPPP